VKNLDALLDKAKWSELTQEEIAEVVKRIENFKENENDLYTLIHILGRSGAWQYRKLVEKFLYYPEESMISRIALKTLCDYWGYAKDYLDVLESFIKGVEWDEYEQIRLSAIRIAGMYIRETNDTSLLRLLLEIFENEKEDEVIRSCAYEAIARAVGRDWNDLPSVRELATLSDEFIDQSVIAQAYQMLKEKRK
jgi:DNA-binding transcriptional regulator YhcF (GntR family)